MFTGLVETTGRIEHIEGTADGRRVVVATSLGDALHLGDSIAVNGVCLTVTSHEAGRFSADISRQTLAVTSLNAMDVGRLVNLERPLRADSRMGGHFVLGHVDGTGTITQLRPDGEGRWLEIDTPASLAPYLISKGSITIDGISLTIAELSGTRVAVQVIPYTFAHTSLQEGHVDDAVNVEVDVLGKYVVRFLDVSRQDAARAVAR